MFAGMASSNSLLSEEKLSLSPSAWMCSLVSVPFGHNFCSLSCLAAHCVPSVRKPLKQGRISRSTLWFQGGLQVIQHLELRRTTGSSVTFTLTPSKRLSNPVCNVHLEPHPEEKFPPESWHFSVGIIRFCCLNHDIVPVLHTYTEMKAAEGHAGAGHRVRESPAEDEDDETLHPAPHIGLVHTPLSHIDLYPLSSPVNTTILPHTAGVRVRVRG